MKHRYGISKTAVLQRQGRLLCVLLALLSASWGAYVNAQVATASINGTVVDASGAIIPDAKITVTQTDTNFTRSTETQSGGQYTLSSLPVGPYRIVAEMKGFGRYEQKGLVLVVGQVATVQISLNVGEQTETVNVSGETPAVETTNPTLQNVVNEKVVSNLPLNGRNPATLMFTTPGVTNAAENVAASNSESTINAIATGFSSASAPTTNGVRPGGTYFSLDGANNIDPLTVVGGPFPNPDATQEFSVVTGSYGSQYFSAPGGAVNIVTRSGTNKIHGSIFEYLRNGYVNARNYFTPTPDILKRNQFGGAIGGPILKDRLFYFGSYQGTIIRNAQAQRTIVPTLAERSGTFTTASGGTVQLPYLDPVAAKLFSLIPLPNNGPQFLNYTVPANSTDNQFVGKLDYTIGRNRLFVRYFGDFEHDEANGIVNNNIFTAVNSDNQHNWKSGVIGNTWTSNAGKWISDTRVSITAAHIADSVPQSNAAQSVDKLGIQNVTPNNHLELPAFIFGGIPTVEMLLYEAPFVNLPRTTWEVQENVIHALGKHQISFGGQFSHADVSEDNESSQNGNFVFTGLAAFYGFGLTLIDSPFADFELGTATQFLQSDGIFGHDQGKSFGFYLEDRFSATNRLTLTVGLRWDPFLPYTAVNGHIDCWRPGQQSQVFTNAPKGVVFPGDSGCDNGGGVTTKYAIVEPRVGVAYSLDNAGKTAVRAGWGIYSTQFPLESFIGFSTPPYSRGLNLTFAPLDNPYSIAGGINPFADGFQGPNYNPPQNVSFATAIATGYGIGNIAPNFRPAYVEQYTLSLQHAFTGADSLEVAYAGTRGVHISQAEDLNLPVFGHGANTTNELQRRPYGSEGLSMITSIESNTTSNYNGLNVTYRHSAKGGLDLTSGFNWSKCLDDQSDPPITLGNSPAVLYANPSAFYGRCNYDQNVSFRTTAVWATPKMAGANRLMRLTLGSWIVSNLFTADAGQPFSVHDSADNSYTGSSLDLANRVPGVPLYVNGQLNRAAFTDNAPGTFGNSGRNAYRQRSYIDDDLGIQKVFPIHDRFNATLRVEAFNIFNHPNLAAINSDYHADDTQATFGSYQFAHDPRISQISMNIHF